MTIHKCVFITALAAALSGGCGSQPVAERSMTTRPVAAISQAPEPAGPKDAPPAIPLVFHVDMYLVSFPQGAYSANEDFWKRMDEQCIDPATADVLYMNGIRIGVAPISEFAHFTKYINDIAPLQPFSMAGAEIRNVELAMKTKLPYQLLFHFDRKGENIGRTFKESDNILNISFEPAMRKPGTLRLTVCPMVRAAQKRLDVTERNNEIEMQYVNDTKIYDLNFKADIPLDCFLIITPSPDAKRESSIGNAFFVKDAPAEKREQVLLVIPKAYKIDSKKP